MSRRGTNQLGAIEYAHRNVAAHVRLIQSDRHSHYFTALRYVIAFCLSKHVVSRLFARDSARFNNQGIKVKVKEGHTRRDAHLPFIGR